MADVIRLEGRHGRAPRKPAIDPACDNKAVILMFTGIRYERLESPTGNAVSNTTLQITTKPH